MQNPPAGRPSKMPESIDELKRQLLARGLHLPAGAQPKEFYEAQWRAMFEPPPQPEPALLGAHSLRVGGVTAMLGAGNSPQDLISGLEQPQPTAGLLVRQAVQDVGGELKRLLEGVSDANLADVVRALALGELCSMAHCLL